MDYDILNSAISDIVNIVNYYNKKHKYSTKICEDLVVALTGYYLVFGPAIFSKVNQVLDALEIHFTIDKTETIEEKKKIIGNGFLFYNIYPETIWKLVLDNKTKKFIGAIPHIIYEHDDSIEEVLTLSHELSHTLEGCTAKVISEDDKTITIKIGFSELTYSKETSSVISGRGHGMTELITVAIENRILQEFSQLDSANVDNPIVREYVERTKQVKTNQVIADSYLTMASIFKDLIDNDKFLELIKKYYYETEQEKFVEEFDALNENLSFKKLIGHANNLYNNNDEQSVLRQIPSIQTQLNILNKATNSTQVKSLIIVL